MMTDNQWDKTTRMTDNAASAGPKTDFDADKTLKAPSSMPMAESAQEPDYESTRRSDMSFNQPEPAVRTRVPVEGRELSRSEMLER